MNGRTGRTASALLVLLVLASQPQAGRSLTRETRQQVREAPRSAREAPKPRAKWVSPMPYTPGPACSPAGVRGIASPAYRPQDYIANVFVENFSAKPVRAVRMAWNVYEPEAGSKKLASRCEPTPEVEILLSGTTPLVELGKPLRKGETCYIGRYEQMVGHRPAVSVTVDWPIVGMAQLAPLMEDWPSMTFKADYYLALYLSEVHFEDGTKWEGQIK